MPVHRWPRRVAPAIAAAGLLVALLGGCAFDSPRSALDPVGPVAEQQMDLFMWTFWLSWIVIIGVGGALVYAIVRFRARPGEDRMPEQSHGNPMLELGLTIVPVIITIMVAVPTVRTILRTESFVEPDTADIVVNVRGYQWWWAFDYPDLGITTANELHVPAGARVVLDLESMDVLHSFWAPKFAGKRDLIPNQDNQLWFDVPEDAEPGVYYGHCAELCLGAHAYMRFLVIVDEPAEFEAWAASFELPSGPAEREVQAVTVDGLEGDPAAGRILFAQKGCANCHTIDGYLGTEGGVAIGDPDFPNLTNFGDRNSIAAAVLANTPENLARWIRYPQEVKPGNYMPTLWSPDDPDAAQEVVDITAYLLSLGTDYETAGPTAELGGAQTAQGGN